jgi:cytochrome c oxidase subunit III
MATFPTTAPPTVSSLSPENDGLTRFELRLRRARLGLLVGLVGVLMIFISFTSAYVVRQGLPTLDMRTGALVHDWLPTRLPGLLFINTFVLLVSSVSMELARRQGAREAAGASDTIADKLPRQPDNISWLALTIVLGATFLAGQWVAWRELAARGFYMATSPSSSFVYLLTGTHGVHLLGGVLALIATGAASLLGRSAKSQAVWLDVIGWYWHFMALLWVYIFLLLKFVG